MDTDNEVLMPTSFLSPCVMTFLTDGGSFDNSSNTCTSHYVNKCGTFNWVEIRGLFGNIEDDFDIHIQDHEWFVTTVRKLMPLFMETVHLLEGGEPDTLKQLWNLCSWTGKQDEIKQQYQHLFPQQEATSVLEMVLLITAVLEHSLGKIFLLKGSNIPFLLRDLLSSQELKSTLGVVPGLNLRNLVWHGFPSTGELGRHFATVLVVLTASLGEALQREGICILSLPLRSQVENLHQLASAVDGWFPDLSVYHKEAKNMFRNCRFIAPVHKETWDIILQHFTESRNGASLALLLPHMEQLLRCVFCWTNSCSQRLLTAQTSEFYTTFDEILAETIPREDKHQTNAIRQVLGDCVIEMLLDMFTLQAGPRIRDKLSHGECEFKQLPKCLVNHIICVSLAVVCKLDKLPDETSSAKQVELREKIVKASALYVSKFHPVSLLKRTITDNLNVLEAWRTIPQPDPKEVTYLQWDEFLKSSDSFLDLRSCLFNRISCRDIKDISLCDILHDFVQDIKVETVYRPKSETTFISLLRRIGDNLTVLCSQVCFLLQEKYCNFNMHKLRSRQRKTYQLILNTCPSLYVAVQCVIMLLVLQLLKVNTIETLSMSQYSTLSRFMKEMLKYAENLVSCTSLEKNRWDVVQMLTTYFKESVCHALESKVL
ncbi:endoplasmic reticulum membrane-associated RNA degradation protein-like isoform X2 [Bacillus rossius redtenbacheri]|uniref:endoplasmic reticulum membrane-associated RNA degradation protein-like isoform X2 n=1 Tax=Bacillus rossius redtenbacheri TaxID=93214 RepID=UPI002FDE586E